MDQTYPDSMCDVVLSQARQNGELVTNPQEDFNTPAMRGSMQQILSENLGQYVVCEFLVGTQGMTQKEGILYSVGRSYITLYEEKTFTFAICDIFSLKFVTFYMPGQRPGQTGSINVPTINVPGIGTVPIGPHGLGTRGTRSGTLPMNGGTLPMNNGSRMMTGY